MSKRFDHAVLLILVVVIVAGVLWRLYDLALDRWSTGECQKRGGVSVHQSIGPVVCVRAEGILK